MCTPDKRGEKTLTLLVAGSDFLQDFYYSAVLITTVGENHKLCLIVKCRVACIRNSIFSNVS